MAAKTFPNGNAVVVSGPDYSGISAFVWVQHIPPVPTSQQPFLAGSWTVRSYDTGSAPVATVPTTGQLWPRRK